MSDQPKKISIVPGFKDILPRDQEFLTYIKKVIRHRCRQGGFRRITTPVIEKLDLFQQALQENSSILDKLYVCEQNNERYALKPEGSIGVARAYIGSNMHEWPQPVQLYYFEPNFIKADESDSKKVNVHYEFGVELIGEDDAALEVQIINLAYKVIQDLGVEHLFKLNLSTLGCEECQKKFLIDLENFYIGKERSLCNNCIDNLNNDIFSLLSCEEEDCQILAELAPPIKNYWCKSCNTKLEDIKRYLSAFKIPFIENNKLGKNKPYYNGIIFKYQENKDKKGSIICEGGQYDKLIASLGGEDSPALGFSMNIETLVKHMKKEKIKVPSKDDIHVFVAQLGREAKEKSLIITDELREVGIRTVGTLGKGSMRVQLSIAEKFKVPYMIIMGITEVREGIAIIRDMKIGSQRRIKLNEVIDEMKKLIGKKELDTYSPGELLY